MAKDKTKHNRRNTYRTKDKDFNDTKLIGIPISIANAFGVSWNNSPSIKGLDDYISSKVNDRIQKAVIFTPSAIGEFLTHLYPNSFQQLKALAPYEVALLTEYPPIDYNCIASMYTGLHCADYKQKCDSCPTLFDVLKDKKFALILPQQSKIAPIFNSPNLDVFMENYDGEVITKAVQLIKENKHDFFIILNQEYKDLMRVSHPLSQKAINAINTHIAAFELLANAAEVYFQDYNTLIGFAPDHGAHRFLLGFGTSGKYIPSDMNIKHYYGVLPKK